MRARGVFLWVVLVLMVPRGLVGQEGPSFDLRRFRPAGSPMSVFSVERSEVLGHLSFAAKLWGEYSHEPLKFEDLQGRERPVVDGTATVSLGLALGLFDWVDVALLLPVVPFQDARFDGVAIENGYVGDLRLIGKVRVLDAESWGGFGLAAGLDLSFPTGDEGAFLGDGFLTGRPFVVADYRLGPVVLVGNLGATLRESGGLLNYRQGPSLDYGFGVVWVAVDALLHLQGELFGALPLGEAIGDDFHRPLELLLGAKVLTRKDIHFTVAGGTGLSAGVGSPAFRVMAGVEYAPLSDDSDGDGVPNAEDLCPNLPGDAAFRGCPNPDSDGDGICDPWVTEQGLAEAFGCSGVDLCPDLAGVEAFSGCPNPDADDDGLCDLWVWDLGLAEHFECRGKDLCPLMPGVSLYSGCPPPDRDQDGYCDAWVATLGLVEAFGCEGVDLCPELAGEALYSGCPDPDQDDDGVCDPWVQELDLVGHFSCDGIDLCPTLAGEAAFFGCPHPDPDGDYICSPFVSELGLMGRFECVGYDQCPDEPETINGIDDDDGCPDEGPRVVIVQADKIEILEPVFFETNMALIRPESYSLLNQVARTILASPSIARVRVEGHTDDRGGLDANMRLSQERAQAVVDYLVGQGVEQDRLEPVGYGPQRPLVPGKSERARSQNRRVEFVLIQ